MKPNLFVVTLLLTCVEVSLCFFIKLKKHSYARRQTPSSQLSISESDYHPQNVLPYTIKRRACATGSVLATRVPISRANSESKHKKISESKLKSS